MSVSKNSTVSNFSVISHLNGHFSIYSSFLSRSFLKTTESYKLVAELESGGMNESLPADIRQNQIHFEQLKFFTQRFRLQQTIKTYDN